MDEWYEFVDDDGKSGRRWTPCHYTDDDSDVSVVVWDHPTWKFRWSYALCPDKARTFKSGGELLTALNKLVAAGLQVPRRVLDKLEADAAPPPVV